MIKDLSGWRNEWKRRKLRASGLSPLLDLHVGGRSVPGEQQDSREWWLSCQLGLIRGR